MIDAMRQQGREPVWGALESNQPSLRLGAKLGFKPMGEIVVLLAAAVGSSSAAGSREHNGTP